MLVFEEYFGRTRGDYVTRLFLEVLVSFALSTRPVEFLAVHVVPYVRIPILSVVRPRNASGK